MFTTDFNNEDGDIQTPTPAEVDEIVGLDLQDYEVEEEPENEADKN